MERVVFGVIGDANAGKSTLLNALVFGDRTLLPSCGVGAVTARPTRLTFAETPQMTIRFEASSRVLELCYAVEHLDAARGGGRVVEREYSTLPRTTRDQLRKTALAGRDGTHRDAIVVRTAQQLEAEARLLVLGDSHGAAPLRLVRTALRYVSSLPVRSDTAALPDAHLAFRIRQLVRSGRSRINLPIDPDTPESLEHLASHISGPFSVLTSEVAVGWPSPMLGSNVELVDLPGLGVAADAYRRCTYRWLEGSEDRLIVVCSRAGISSSTANALVESGFLSRLLARHPSRGPSFVVAVTKLDDEARQIRRHSAGSLLGHFEALARQVPTVIHSQLSALLQRTGHSERQRSALRLVAEVPVVAVAAPAYLALARGDDEQRAFFRQPAQTNIPLLAAVLAGTDTHVSAETYTEAVR